MFESFLYYIGRTETTTKSLKLDGVWSCRTNATRSESLGIV